MKFRHPVKSKLLVLISSLARKQEGLVKNGQVDDGHIGFRIPSEADVTLDGRTIDNIDQVLPVSSAGGKTGPESKKRKLDNGDDGATGGLVGQGIGRNGEWMVRTGQWRLRYQIDDARTILRVELVAVKIDAVTGERAKNAQRRFLD